MKYFNLPDNDLPRWIWDIDNAVGVGCPNNRSDVGLIQTILNKLIRPNNLRDETGRFETREENPLLGISHGYPAFDFLEVDGVFGSKTTKVLDAWRKKKFFTRGQMVSPLKTGLEGGRGTKYDYTIFGLNNNFYQLYHRMPSANDAPEWLKPHFA